MIRLSEFDFNLPEELIAQNPLLKRDNSRLLVLGKNSGSIKHEHFYDVTKYFNSGDVLVLNETKVIPARLYGKKLITGANIEILLLKEIKNDVWEALVKPARRIGVNDIVFLSDKLSAKCISVKEEGIRVFEMIYKGIFIEILEEIGTMPLPPYITKRLNEKERYQTVYAKELGSAAAPTAGLHFTDSILGDLKKKGVRIIPVTLHVGLGTFRPVSAENIEEHKMHSEVYHISENSANELNEAVRNKKKIIAVGTTSVRTLESNYNNGFTAGVFDTSIFIYPGYKFKVVNEIITNFHLPKSSLIMLISAFSSKENVLNAYNEAIKEKYRFFSFGDAMLIRNE